MKIAIIGSRDLSIDISSYIPDGVTEVISGGAIGIDTQAEIYADERNLPMRIIKPDYEKYGRIAPLKRNEIIVNTSDMIIAIWNGASRGTKYTIDYAYKVGKPIKVYIITQ